MFALVSSHQSQTISSPMKSIPLLLACSFKTLCKHISQYSLLSPLFMLCFYELMKLPHYELEENKSEACSCYHKAQDALLPLIFTMSEI